MRLWSLHPQYLDSKGLVALWREALLAQKVLAGETRGYVNHPQLQRFKKTINPSGMIASYLSSIANEADRRGYNFDRGKIVTELADGIIECTEGQLAYEVQHLSDKLKKRDQILYFRLQGEENIALHPLFVSIPGDVESWEVVS